MIQDKFCFGSRSLHRYYNMC